MMKTFNDTPKKIINFLEKEEEGSTFIYEDFLSCGNYENVRSAVVNLCERNILIRVCQGVYMKPKRDDITFRPPIYQIIKEFDRRNRGVPIPKEETRKYLNGELDYKPQTLLFYTSSSTRQIKLLDGTIVKFYHRKKM